MEHVDLEPKMIVEQIVLHTEKEYYLTVYFNRQSKSLFAKNRESFSSVFPIGSEYVHQLGTKVKHYGGGVYQIMFNDVIEEETGEKLVIYRRISDQLVFARPQEMFYGNVTIDGKEVPRFEEVQE